MRYGHLPPTNLLHYDSRRLFRPLRRMEYYLLLRRRRPAGTGPLFSRFNFGVAGWAFERGMSRRQSLGGGNERVDAAD